MAHDFGTSIAQLSYAITMTLAMRPVGASIFRMARIVRRRCVADIFGHLHSRAGAGIARVAEAKIDRELLVEPRRSREAALAAFSLRDLVDDGVQRHVAWNAGHVSNVSRRTTWLRRRTKIDNRRDLRGGCDLRRNGCRSSLAKMGP